jgi:hypothetical protein
MLEYLFSTIPYIILPLFLIMFSEKTKINILFIFINYVMILLNFFVFNGFHFLLFFEVVCFIFFIFKFKKIYKKITLKELIYYSILANNLYFILLSTTKIFIHDESIYLMIFIGLINMVFVLVEIFYYFILSVKKLYNYLKNIIHKITNGE